ncbi:ATP-dependent DNA helicase RecG [Patescibacteria group bacterium]|nr:ATP-dependent DNA helicase RecG [Patescibacteria group bacterium]
MEMDTPIKLLSRVGKTTAGRLKNLGLEQASDLIFYFPFRYDDFSLQKKISDLLPDEAVTIKVRVQLIATRRSFRKRKILTEALVSDDSGSLKVIWFNQPFLTKMIKPGDEIYLSGKIDESRIQMVSPDFEKVKAETVHTARLVPIYHLTSGITQKQLRFLLHQTLPLMKSAAEFLPKEIIDKYEFPSLARALVNIHFPRDAASEEDARARLSFDELFLIQLAIQLARKKIREKKSPSIAFLEKQTKDFVAGLPFELTPAQKKCSWEIIKDLQKENPMNRLLEGDVGSGKTVAVALAMLNAALNGYKTVMMAPTEILAEQHYQTLQKLFSKQSFKIILFTSSKREINGEKLSKKQLLDKLGEGEFDIVVGTQSVIQENVKIKDLGLVVVDEQHRFGVNQRKALVEKNNEEIIPHFLSMTATPIPRSLVLTLYGDLDLSIINQMPAGRKKIITKVVYEQNRLEAYEFIRRQIADGRQVFVICPLIDPSDKLGVKSVTQEYERLKNEIFPELNLGIMHGRLKSKEKEEVMMKFKEKEYDILVSTSVIEVGIDVPNSTIMMIEGSDRFGLAQLHQFRGRVGRGEFQSYCYLFSENGSPLTQKRLKYLETCSDGFSLAEKDLELRGSGEVYGTRQSGLPDLKIASLTDVETIKIAQLEAKSLVEKNGITPELASALKKLNLSLHFE